MLMDLFILQLFLPVSIAKYCTHSVSMSAMYEKKVLSYVNDLLACLLEIMQNFRRQNSNFENFVLEYLLLLIDILKNRHYIKLVRFRGELVVDNRVSKSALQQRYRANITVDYNRIKNI